jgi:hypothetical protein
MMVDIKIKPLTYQQLNNYTHEELSEVKHSQLQGKLDFKTDWTKDDYYNFNDLNSVEIKTRLIAEQIELLKVCAINISNIENRDIKSIEFSESLNRIEENIKLLGNILHDPAGFMKPKTYWRFNMPFSYEDANRLETNLEVLYKYVTGNISYFRHCGAYTCGEEI